MLTVPLVHTDIRGDDGIRDAPSARARHVELTHVRTVTGFLAAITRWRFDAILFDSSPLSPASRAVLAAPAQRRSITPTIALSSPAAEDRSLAAQRGGAADYVPGEH